MARVCNNVDSLNPRYYEQRQEKVVRKEVVDDDMAVPAAVGGYSLAGKSWGHLLLFFIAAVLIIYLFLLLIGAPPLWLQARDPTTGQYTGALDNGKAFGIAIVGAIIATAIYWLLTRK